MKTLGITFQLVLATHIHSATAVCSVICSVLRIEMWKHILCLSDCLQVVFSVTVHRDFGKVLWRNRVKVLEKLKPLRWWWWLKHKVGPGKTNTLESLAHMVRDLKDKSMGSCNLHFPPFKTFVFASLKAMHLLVTVNCISFSKRGKVKYEKIFSN